MKPYRKYACLIILLIALPIIIFAGFRGYQIYDQKTNYIFWGSPRFEEYTRQYKMTKEEAEEHLMNYLVENKLSYRPFPYQVVMADDGGYLFINDECKLSFGLLGYRVGASGEVEHVDYEKRLDVRYYDGNRDLEYRPTVYEGQITN